MPANASPSTRSASILEVAAPRFTPSVTAFTTRLISRTVSSRLRSALSVSSRTAERRFSLCLTASRARPFSISSVFIGRASSEPTMLILLIASVVMAAQFIENRTYDEIKAGDSATLTRTLKPEDIQLFAVMSGDVNPAHVDPEYAHSGMFHEVIAHGMWGGALISTVLGTEFPGPGTIYISQTLRFSRPVKVGDTITIRITCKQKFDHNKHILFDCLCTNQDGLKVISGEAEVLAPTEKVKRERMELPEVTISDRWARYKRLLARATGRPAATAAFAQPVHAESLQSAAAAAESGFLRPVLLGPEKTMREVARQNNIDLLRCRLIDVPHARVAVARAVEMARSGDADIGVQRFSHVLYLDVPNYPRPIIVSDMMLNIEPSLEEKVEIVQNAIDFAHLM